MSAKTLPITLRFWYLDEFLKKLKKLRLLAKRISIPGFRYKRFTVCLSDDDLLGFGGVCQKTILIYGSKLTDEEIHKYEKIFNDAARKIFDDSNIRTFINRPMDEKFIHWDANFTQ